MKRALALVMCVGLLGSCNKGGSGGAASGGGSKQESLLDLVPGSALGALVLRADAFKVFRMQLDDDPEMTKELREYLVKRVGLDFTKVTAALVVVTSIMPPTGALLLRMPTDGTPTWQKSGEADGVPLYAIDDGVVAATVPAGLVLGTEPGVRAMIAVAQKKAPALKKGDKLDTLLELDGATSFFAGVSADVIPDPQVRPMIDMYGVATVTVGYSPQKVFLWANGDAQKLTMARDAAKGFIDMGLGKLKEERDKAVAGDSTVMGAMSIVSYRSYLRMAPKVTPRLEGSRLVVDYVIPKDAAQDGMVTLMTASAVVGILAAVAIPAFMKYTRRSKTIEATMNLRKLFDSQVAFYEAEQADGRRRFAGDADWTPALPCAQGPEGKCAPDPKVWAVKPWTDLSFSVDDPHYYQYRVQATKTGFVVEARGDLDGDGTFSLYRRTGSVTAEGNVTGGMGLYSENDIE